MPKRLITLTHFVRGPMQVRIADDATFWLGCRQWTDDDSDGAIYDEGDFEESPEDIDKLLQMEAAR
jgi:hypothetical protein